MSRAFIGRMIADLAFLYKFLLEQTATVGCCVWSEFKNRKERIKQEWDLALINVLTVTTCNAIVVWSLAPCRSYGNTFRFDLQNTLQKLPNNIFEKSYPLQEFDLQKRIQSFLCKAAELCMVGFTDGAVQGGLTNLCARKKEGRALSIQLGETSRLAWLGVEVDPLANLDNILRAYGRPSEAITQPSSDWFISKNAIVSGLGLLGIRQGQHGNSNIEGETSTPKARRKRIVKRKVSTSSA